jgi:serine/threonine-protein kinase
MDNPHEQSNQLPNPWADSDIDLEPTVLAVAPPDDRTNYATTSVDRESTGLLRSRLLAVAGCFLVIHVIFLVVGAASPVYVYHATALLLLRFVGAAAVLGVLVSRLALTRRQLRLLEGFLFGVEVFTALVAQYWTGTLLADQGNELGMVAFEKNGVLRIIVAMLIYGVFIPNTPRVTARVVFAMAASLIIVHGMVLNYQLKMETIVDDMTDAQNAVSNALFLLIGAGVATFSAYTLRGLRREVYNARRLGQYQLFDKLGGGGMGEVYLAEHQLLKRPCALKLIRPDMERDPVAMARFEREVQSAAMLSHPNTIEIFDYGHTEDGTFYYVMEYLPGLTVSDLVRQTGPMSPGRAVFIMRQVCGSLAEAHRKGLVHRDLKPANIFVAVLGGQCDVAKVLDFGVVKQQQPTDGRQLTVMYTVSGTPLYMSPEQAMASPDLDGRSDLYSLGAILYFMLTGTPPFDGATPIAVMLAHASEPVKPPTQIRADIPADLEAVVLRCLAKKAADRFTDTLALAAALDACRCAADWNQAQAEAWWLEHAAAQAPSVETSQTASP